MNKTTDTDEILFNPKFYALSFYLEIETTNTAPQKGLLLNQFEESDSTITSMSLSPPTILDDNIEEFIELTEK